MPASSLSWDWAESSICSDLRSGTRPAFLSASMRCLAAAAVASGAICALGGGAGRLRCDKSPDDWPTCAVAGAASIIAKATDMLSLFFMDPHLFCVWDGRRHYTCILTPNYTCIKIKESYGVPGVA